MKMGFITKFKKYTIFIIVVFLVSGCFPEYHSRKNLAKRSDKKKDINKIYDAIMKKIDLEGDTYVYPDHKLPDPFQSIFDKKVGDSTPIITPDIKVTENISKISELQRFDLDELKLVGLIYGTTSNDRRALLKDPTGKTHNVREREFVGKNSGRILSIKKDRIIINEESYELSGKRIVNRIPIKLETEE